MYKYIYKIKKDTFEAFRVFSSKVLRDLRVYFRVLIHRYYQCFMNIAVYFIREKQHIELLL